jgi:Flp pilus assembly protein TadG
MPTRKRLRAQTIVEFALILPIFLLLVAGTIEFGRALFAYAQLLQAAQEGARYGAVLPNARNNAAIIARVQSVSPGGGADTVTVSSTVSPTNNATVNTANRARGNVLTVTAEHQQAVLVPFLPIPSFSLFAGASMVIE